ncbi:MAG: hypothetical protein JWL77_330 [Chthonomonadaceae bacterium]|nr:hypothetical protein [Chthonomonadaceae bacterium]
MSALPCMIALTLLTLPGDPGPRAQAKEKPDVLRANYIVAVADDFIVEVYHNGKSVPESKRVLLNERFGATTEQIDEPVHKGDWLVFHVVNNRLRWGGASYFAVAGCFTKDEFGFNSTLGDGNWSACDTPRDADRFIANKNFLRHHPAHAILQPWSDGTTYMRAYAGASWNGTPLWGTARSTWIKVIVE